VVGEELSADEVTSGQGKKLKQKWTKVSEFLDWIEDLLEEDDADMCAYDHSD